MTEDGKNGGKDRRQHPPFLTPKTLELIEKGKEFNEPISVSLKPGTSVGVGMGQQSNLHTGTPGSGAPVQTPVPTPSLADTRSPSAVENILGEIDNRVRLLSDALYAVFGDANDRDVRRAKQDKIDSDNLSTAKKSFVAVVIIGLFSLIATCYFGYMTLASGDDVSGKTSKQAVDQLAVMHQLVDSQASEINLLQQQLVELRRLVEIKGTSVEQPPKGRAAPRRRVRVTSSGGR